MRQSGSGENGQLLAADHGVHAVDGADAGLDELVGIVARIGIHGQSVHVDVFLGDDGRAAVDGIAAAVEDAAEHVFGDGQLQRFAEEGDGSRVDVEAVGALENLHDGAAGIGLQHFAAAAGAVGQRDFHQRIVGNFLDALDDQKGARKAAYGSVFNWQVHLFFAS